MVGGSRGGCVQLVHRSDTQVGSLHSVGGGGSIEDENRMVNQQGTALWWRASACVRLCWRNSSALPYKIPFQYPVIFLSNINCHL